jgi:hypothetical protein
MTTLTGDGITYYQLAAVKAALKLERVGLKHSSGRAIRPAWAKRLGLKSRDSYELYIETIDKKLSEMRAALHSQSVNALETCA